MPYLSGNGRTCAADCNFNPEGCGLTSRGHTGRCTCYSECRVETLIDGRAADVDGLSEEGGGRGLVSKERSGALWYSAQWRDRLCPIKAKVPP